MHLYVEPLQRAKAIERLWVLYELATNFDAYGELSLGFSKKGHAELLGIARGLATEFESDARCRDGAGLRAAKARPHCVTTSAATHLHPHHLLHHLADHNADFGNGWYNDHHFHYGYFIYAAAAVGVGNASFLKRWDVAVRHMVRHIAHPIYPDPTP